MADHRRRARRVATSQVWHPEVAVNVRLPVIPDTARSTSQKGSTAMRMPWSRKQAEPEVEQEQRALERTAIAAVLVATDTDLPTTRRLDAARVLEETQSDYLRRQED